MQTDKFCTLQWLMSWYNEQCNNVWDSSMGVTINTLDNPGWDIYIDVKNTSLNKHEILYTSDPWDEKGNWYGYSIREGIFNGYGDPDKLSILILSFKKLWDRFSGETISNESVARMTLKIHPTSSILYWLMQWYKERCDGEWEHAHSVQMKTSNNCSWMVQIKIADTPMEAIRCNNVKVVTAPNDWYTYQIVDSDNNGREFIGNGDASKLEVILQSFKQLWEEHTQTVSKK